MFERVKKLWRNFLIHVVLLAWTAVEAWLCLRNEILYTKANSVMDHSPEGTISEGLIDGQDSLAGPVPSVPPSRWIRDERVTEGGLSHDKSPWLESVGVSGSSPSLPWRVEWIEMALWCTELSLVHTSGGSHDKEKNIRAQRALSKMKPPVTNYGRVSRSVRTLGRQSREHTILGPLQSMLELSIALTYGPALWSLCFWSCRY